MNSIGHVSRPPPVPRLRFDTGIFQRTERAAAWRDNIGVFFDLAAPDGGRQDAEISASIDACALAGTVFGVTTSRAQLFQRSENRVLHDQMEHFLVQVFLKGGGRTRDGETIQAGDMLIIDLDQPHHMVTTDFSNLTLVLPRELDAELSRILARLHARRLARDNPMIGLLASHLRAMWDSVGAMTVEDAGAVLKGTVGLMNCWLGDRPFRQEDLAPEVSAGLARAIREHIDAHIEQPLRPEHLAVRFRVSRSQLYRMFKAHDGVARYIWERRLTKSMRMLGSPLFAETSVSAVAYRCGFSSEPHFSRSFKERFGMTPSRFRQDALEALALRADPPANDEDVHRRFAAWVRNI